ncbi:MAG TPA: glycosyl transferase, partial [Desulfitobacteriaceae bacterium]|nr:glycosyl transferase [Desulfitobacteriaceae bacterium]
MISHILFNSPLRSLRQDSLKSRKGQAALWVYGISGDLPIVLLVMRNTEDVNILYEILAAHEYWRIKDLNVDLIILSEEENSYLLPLFSLVSEIVSAAQKYFPLDIEGKIHILDKNKVADEDVALLNTISRIVLANDGGTLSDQMSAQKVLPLPLPRIWKASPKAYPLLSPAHLELNHFNGWGGFSPDAGEYVIQLEQDQYTPAPWINVIANQKFGFLVSESGGGYSWCENSHENKLSTWSNDPVCDDPGEVIYICDGDTGELWTVTALPVREAETYVIRHGFGYSVFEHTSHGIGQQQVQFVPLDEMVKVSIMRLTNHSEETRNLTLTYYMRPVLGVTDQDTAMHIKTSRSKTGAILVENPYNEEFPGKVCILDVSREDRSITGDRKEFFGSGDLLSPESLQRVNLSGTTGAGFDPCAALQVKLTLNPNVSEQVVFVLGMADNQEAAEISAGKYLDAANALQALAVVRDFWQKKLSLVKIHTPADSMDYLMNGWLQYQVMSCRLWARSAFYQSGGAFGFRDQLQDSLSIAHICPEISRAQILLHARHQFVEGDVQHWWHEPTGRGIRTRFSDDLLWLPYVTAEYIRISGDMAILEERLPYLEDDLLKSDETEKYGKPSVSKIDETLYEHCLKAIEKSLSFGQHGLPLMGSGDWNDSMNTVGYKGRGESVWLAWFMISVLDKFSSLCRQTGEEERASNYEEIKRKIAAAVEQNAWDGSWYRRAYFDDGTPLGSIQNTECKIDAIAQAWSVISGAGNPERALLAMNSLENYLVQWEDGLIKLLTPAFDQGDLEPGYIKGYLPGVRENGGQYSHAAVWVVIAYALLGDGDKAGQLFELLNPVNHTRSQKECLRYKVEPYVMPADVYALQPSAGRGGWTWYTGSAGWMYRAGLEYTLGFQKNGNSVIMNPCIPKKWTEYSIEYQYINTMYSIKIKNPERINKGVKYISVDGKIYNENVIPLVNDRKNHNA